MYYSSISMSSSNVMFLTVCAVWCGANPARNWFCKVSNSLCSWHNPLLALLYALRLFYKSMWPVQGWMTAFEVSTGSWMQMHLPLCLCTSSSKWWKVLFGAVHFHSTDVLASLIYLLILREFQGYQAARLWYICLHLYVAIIHPFSYLFRNHSFICFFIYFFLSFFLYLSIYLSSWWAFSGWMSVIGMAWIDISTCLLVRRSFLPVSRKFQPFQMVLCCTSGTAQQGMMSGLQLESGITWQLIW